MPTTIDHLLVPARDKQAAAQWLGDLLRIEVTGRSAGAPEGFFAVVRVGDITVDFGDVEEPPGNHIAFLVSDSEFDRIFRRVTEQGFAYSADPGHRRTGELNDNEGGRGFYVKDPDNNNYEFLTRTI